MAVETSAVQIVVNVTDANSGAVIAGVEQNISKLGAAGTTSGQQMRRGMEEAGAGALSAREKTRLLSEEFGIRIPRAMQSLIAQSTIAKSALSVLGGAMIGLGTIQIGAMVFTALFEGAKKLYEKFLDVDGALQRFNDEAGEAASKKFYEDAGLDQLNADLREANQQLDQLNRQKGIATKWEGTSWGEFGSMLKSSVTSIATFGAVPYKYGYGVAGAKAQNYQQGIQDTDSLKNIENTHKRTLQQIEDSKLISEAKVTGIAKARVAQDAENKKADEDQRFAKQRAQALAEVANRGIDNTRWYGNLKPGDKGYREAVVVSSDTGNAENADAKAHSAAEYQAQQFEIGRSQSQDLAHMREQALEAGLHGSALYHAQEAAAIQDLKFKDMDSVAARNAIHAKFHAEEMNRLRAEQDETEKLGRTAAMAGMTGIQKTQAEGANRVADINTDADKVGLDPAERAKRIAFANQETNQQIAEEQRTFTQEINALADSSAAHQVQGFARIHAEAAKELDGLQKKFDEVYGHMDRSTPGGEAQYQQGVSQLHAGQGMIASGESGQATELARKNEQETEQIEAQARIKFFDAEKQKTQAIKTELEERLQKYKEEQVNEGLSQDDYNRRVVAAQLEANAQMIQAATEARQKMAGEFTHLFSSMDHPLKALAEMGDKAAGEAAASLWQRFQGKGAAPAMKDIPANSLNSVIGGFGFHVGGHKPGRGSGPGRAGQRRSSQRACTRLRG
jgi:hypothetical protein